MKNVGMYMKIFFMQIIKFRKFLVKLVHRNDPKFSDR